MNPPQTRPNLVLTRRQMLVGLAGLSLSSFAVASKAQAKAPTPGGAPDANPGLPGMKPFPRGFRWGVATAAHQIEGNNVNSDFWFLENLKPTTFAERSGDACDSYHRYEEDIALLAGLGFNTYRLSVEWARIEPSQGCFSMAELDYYRRVLACCHRHGVVPAVTFYHCTAPHWFAAAGGWLNPESPKLFARYCSTVAKALGNDMGYAFTINEPQVAKSFRALMGASRSFGKRDEAARVLHLAAAKAANSERYISMEYPDIDAMSPQLLAGHAQGYSAIKAECGSLPVSVTLNMIDYQPANEESPVDEARKYAYGEWLDLVSQSADFAAVQVYRQMPIPGKGKANPVKPRLPYLEGEHSMLAPFSRPEAVRNIVEYAHRQTKKPVMITENGMETENDQRRIWYIGATLAGLQESIASGTPVIGYLHWSLLDNFEWTQGYRPKYGLVAVDRATFKRSPKPSSAYLGEIARRNAI